MAANLVDSLALILYKRDSLIAALSGHPILLSHASHKKVEIMASPPGLALWGVSAEVILGCGISVLGIVATAFMARKGWDAAARTAVQTQERQWAEDRRQRTERLVLRIRSALETAEVSARSAIKRGDGRAINPEIMNGIILDWQRFDRVSDDLRLLDNPAVEERVDSILGFARLSAEKIILDERSFRETRDKLGTVTPKGLVLDDSVLTGIVTKRGELLGLLSKVEAATKALRVEFNTLWPPPAGQPIRDAAQTVGDTGADLP